MYIMDYSHQIYTAVANPFAQKHAILKLNRPDCTLIFPYWWFQNNIGQRSNKSFHLETRKFVLPLTQIVSEFWKNFKILFS